MLTPDLFSGAALAESGAAAAAAHAEAVVPGWFARACAALDQFIRHNAGREFTASEVAAAAEADGLPTPPDRRAWGRVFSLAARDGVIVRHGVTTSPVPTHHAGFVSLWAAR